MLIAALAAEMSAAFADPALPTNGTVAAGSATIATTSSATTATMTVNQTSPRALIDWTTFNIGSGGTVTFVQPTTASVAVNRVDPAGGRSIIDGALGANGNVMILNPNGVAFTATAIVDVAGLVASTGNIGAGFDPNSTGPIAITGATGGSIVNQGSVTVTNAGLAAFVAPSVVNSGTISAETGRVVLAGAQAATVSLNGGLYEIAVDQSIANGAVANTGTLRATNGSILLSAEDASSAVSGAINLSGVQQANRIEVRGNRVVLASDLNAATVTGNSNAIEVQSGAQIQDAIDVAKAGGPGAGAMVDVDAGSYSEQLQVDKANLTLSGKPGAKITVPDGASVDGITIGGNTSNVTVSGFEIAGPVTSSYLTYGWGSNVTRGIVVRKGASAFALSGNDIHDIRTGILIDGRDGAGTGTVTGSVTGNRIENTKSGISVQYTDGGGISISGNGEGPIGNEWGVNLHLNGFLDAGTLHSNPYHATPTPAWQQALLDLSAANAGWTVQDQGYSSSNRTHVQVATSGVSGNQGSPLKPLDTIANGINAAVAGGTVNVAAGTYTQASTLNVSKRVTLAGAGEAQTTIDARGVKGYGVSVSADDVTLSDLTVYGPADYFASAYGIKVSPGGVPSSRLNNFTIRNVTSRGAGKAELDLNGVDGATIDHVTADGAPVGNDAGTTQGAGIQLTDSANITVTGSTTRNNAWGGIAIYQANRSYDQQANGITIAESNTLAESNPLYLQDESASWNFGTLNLPAFPYAVRNAATADSAQYTWMQPTRQAALDYAVNLPGSGASYVQGWSGGAATQDLYVGTGNLAGGGTQALSLATAVDVAVNFADPVPSTVRSWNATASRTDFYVGIGLLAGGGTQAMSIATAVDRAESGATISVGAGSYAEQLDVAKSLTLSGAGAGRTILAPASLVADGSGMRNILTIGGGPGTHLALSGFTLRGPVPALTTGIFVRDGAQAAIHDNSLVDMRESTSLSGNQRGVAILVGRALLATSGTADIANNVVTGYQKGGIVVDGPGSQATITGNTITGEGPTAVIAQNGIQVSRGASATLTGNTVSGNVYTGSHAEPDDFAAGILYFASGPYVGQGGIALDSSNTVTGNEFGIWTNDASTLATINLSGASGNARNAVAYVAGGYAGLGPLLEYPAWAASSTARVDPAAFAGSQPGDILDVGGSLRVAGWSGFTTIQPAVDAVAGGGTIDVAAGTFVENVTVSAPLNLSFAGTKVSSLTVGAGAGGSGIGGSVSASTAAGIHLDAPVVLLSNTTLATSGGPVSAGTIDGTTAGAQSLTIDARSGAVSLGNLGATTRLGTTEVTGTISLAGSSYASNSLRFAGPVALTQAATTLATNGGLLTAGAIDGTVAGGQSLTINTGAGAVSLGNLGATTRLGATEVTGTISLTGSSYSANSLVLNGPSALTQAATTLATNGGAVSTGAIDGTSDGAQALTINAASGAVSLGDLGATARLGATAVTGTISLAGSSYRSVSLSLDGPATLTRGATTVATNGGAVSVGAIDGSSAGAQGLTIDAGAGRVSLGALGAATPLGATVVNGGSVDLSAPLLASSLSGGSGAANVHAAARVQDGIDITMTGGAVDVAAGSYGENVVVNSRRNLAFGAATVHSLTIGAGAGGTGLGGSVTADGAAGFSIDAPVVLRSDTTLVAGGGAVRTVAIDGATDGAQALTIDAGSGAVSLGALGAAKRLGPTGITGTIRLTGAGYSADTLDFAGPVTLTQATTLTTGGGAINVGGDIQNAGTTPLALSLQAGPDGARGDVALVSGGTQTNPLGTLQVAAGDFTLTGTLWVTDYRIDARGAVALSNHTLNATNATAANVITAGGAVSGSTVSGGSVSVTGGEVSANVTSQAGAAVSGVNVSGNVAGSDVTVSAQNRASATVTAQGAAKVSGADVGGSITGTDVTVSAQKGANATVSARGAASVSGADVGGSVSGSNVTVQAQKTASATVTAQGTASVSGADVSGSVSGSNVTVSAQNRANATVSARGAASVSGTDVSGSVAGASVTISAQKSVNASVAAQDAAHVSGASVSGSLSGATVTVTAQNVTNASIAASGSASIDASESVQATVNAGTTTVRAGGSAALSGSSSQLTLDAPGGSVSGSFGEVTNVGSGLIHVNGRPHVNTGIAQKVDNINRVIRSDSAVLGGTAAGAEAAAGALDLAPLALPATPIVVPAGLSSPRKLGDFFWQGRSAEIDLAPRRDE